MFLVEVLVLPTSPNVAKSLKWRGFCRIIWHVTVDFPRLFTPDDVFSLGFTLPRVAGTSPVFLIGCLGYTAAWSDLRVDTRDQPDYIQAYPAWMCESPRRSGVRSTAMKAVDRSLSCARPAQQHFYASLHFLVRPQLLTRF